MEFKLNKMQNHCTNMFRLVNILWLFVFVYIGIYIVYSVFIITIKPSEFKAVSYQNTQVRITNERINAYIGNDIPELIVVNRAYDIDNSKKVHIVCLFGHFVTECIPLFFILYYTKSILHKMAWGKTPFSFDCVKKISLIGYILIITSALRELLWIILVRFFITNDFHVSLKLGLGGIISGFIVLGLARVFDYVCELQKAYDETL